MEGRLQDTRDEVAALRDLLQSMLRLEDGGPSSGDSASDADTATRPQVVEDAASGSTRSTRSAASSDGYSPVAIDDAAPPEELAPPARRPSRTRHEPSRHDVRVRVQRWCVGQDAKGTRVESSSATRTRPAEKASCSGVSGSVSDSEATRPPVGFVNKKSIALLRKSGSFEPDFQTRMQRCQQKSRQRKDELRQRAVVAEQTSVHAPEINTRSKRLRRRVSHLLAWHNQKESKLSRLRAAEATKEVAPCEARPAVSSHSHDLLAHRRHEIAGCKVEDRLQLLGLIYQYEKEERALQQQQQTRQVAGPRLAPHSLNLARCRERPVFERLSAPPQRRQRPPGRVHAREGGREGDDGPRRGLRRGVVADGESDVVARLYVMADRYKQRRIQRSERQAAEAAGRLTTPTLSARSRHLAMKRRQPGQPKPGKRLCLCCSRATADCIQQQQSPRRVDSKSASAIYDKHVRWQQQREARRLAEKRRSEQAQMQECTFRNPWFRPAWGPAEEDPSRLGNEGFYRRSKAWAAQREQALETEKKVWRQLEMTECTFKPRVSQRGGAAGAAEPSASDGRRPSRSTATSARVGGYSATDLEALASTSCSDSDWLSGVIDWQEERSPQGSSASDWSPLLRRVSGVDAREFAGR